MSSSIWYQVQGFNRVRWLTKLVSATRSSTTRRAENWPSLRDVVRAWAFPVWKAGPQVQWGIPSIPLPHRLQSGFGDSSEGPYENDNGSLQFIDNLSLGTRQASFQLRWRSSARQIRLRSATSLPGAQFGFNPEATRNHGASGIHAGGNAFADYLLGHLQAVGGGRVRLRPPTSGNELWILRR